MYACVSVTKLSREVEREMKEGKTPLKNELVLGNSEQTCGMNWRSAKNVVQQVIRLRNACD